MTNETITGIKRLTDLIGGDNRWDVNITGGSISGVTISDVTINANELDGTTLASNVVNSSLTSVGTLANLTVTNPIAGSITGNAATVTTNANLTGAVTSVGNATSLGSFTSAQLATALTDETGSGANVFATSPVLVTPALGTPSSGTLTNCTGLPISTGVSGLGTGVATFLATPSSANLAAAITNETGSGALVFGTAPTLSGDVIQDVVKTSGSSGVVVKNSGGTTVATFGSANTTNVSLAGAVTVGGTLTPSAGINCNSPSGAIVLLGGGSSGSIDNLPIGVYVPTSGAFTTIAASGLISANGGQIAFPATQNPSANANTLDDYEEGTFTPDLFFGGGNTGITYTSRVGKYTKIGNRVDITVSMILSSKGSSTGVATITTAPFTASNSSAGFLVLNAGGSSWANNTYLLISGTTFYFRANSTTGITQLTDTSFTATTDIFATITYFV